VSPSTATSNGNPRNRQRRQHFCSCARACVRSVRRRGGVDGGF
jgi:hypothetical protein